MNQMFIADSVVDFPFFDSSQAVAGWGLARVDGMGFFYLQRGDVGFMAWGRDVWAGRLMEWREGGFNLWESYGFKALLFENLNRR